MHLRFIIGIFFLAIFTICLPFLEARDWFVRAGVPAGNGSLAKPFGDPWQALEVCEAGDRIHVTAGQYYGKLDCGTWVIPFPKVELLGGYDKEFKERDPWKYASELLWNKKSKNHPTAQRLYGSGDMSDCVIDGFVFDSKDENDYTDEQQTSRDLNKLGTCTVLLKDPATFRNCVIVNSPFDALRCKPGSTIENNLIINALETGIKLESASGELAKKTAVIRNNTVLFTWEYKGDAGKGAYRGCAIAINGPAVVENNILAHSDNHAIFCTIPPEKVAVKNNVFHMNLFSNFKFYSEGRDIAIDNDNMDSLEEVGLKEYEENVVLDPQLDLDSIWMDKFSQRSASLPGKVVMDDWNKMRRLLGLPIIATGGKSYEGLAPAYNWKKALAILSPKNGDCKAGARIQKCEIKFSVTETAPVEAKQYEKIKMEEWANNPESVVGKSLEMVAVPIKAINVDQLDSIKPQIEIKPQIHLAVQLFKSDGSSQGITGYYGGIMAYYRKGSSVERLLNNMSCYSGSGLVKDSHRLLIRGIACVVRPKYSSPKPGIVIEAAEAYETPAVQAVTRPVGRDWFVKADAKSGDGSLQKPFKDPFQALERAEAGDIIHVAEGVYTGRLKTGIWKVDCRYLTLMGGYDKNFKERDPWAHPTVLIWPKDSKTRGGGWTLEGVDDHTGFILDGFVFDKKHLNKYLVNGDLEPLSSDKTEHVRLTAPDCTIRNCVFLNGALGAIIISNSQTVENCIFMNHATQAIYVAPGNVDAPAVIRNNVILFVWDKRFGDGASSTGIGIRLERGVKATIEGNVLEFIDNNAITCNADVKDVTLRNNVFAHNLWSNFRCYFPNTVVDDDNMGKLADLGFNKCEGNLVLLPQIPVDEKWFNIYLSRTAYVPGKVTMDEWNEVRRILGQPLIATGGKRGEGLAPAYDLKKALTLFPQNPKCTVGAKRLKLEAKFSGITRQESTQKYENLDWDALKTDGKKWEEKRVAIKVALGAIETPLSYAEGTNQEEYLALRFLGPDGMAGSNRSKSTLAFVKKGTRFERMAKNAPKYPADGKPEAVFTIKGVVKKEGQIIVEILEKTE